MLPVHSGSKHHGRLGANAVVIQLLQTHVGKSYGEYPAY